MDSKLLLEIVYAILLLSLPIRLVLNRRARRQWYAPIPDEIGASHLFPAGVLIAVVVAVLILVLLGFAIKSG